MEERSWQRLVVVAGHLAAVQRPPRSAVCAVRPRPEAEDWTCPLSSAQPGRALLSGKSRDSRDGDGWQAELAASFPSPCESTFLLSPQFNPQLLGADFPPVESVNALSRLLSPRHLGHRQTRGAASPSGSQEALPVPSDRRRATAKAGALGSLGTQASLSREAAGLGPPGRPDSAPSPPFREARHLPAPTAGGHAP
ncbi:hypothetical protein HJG60_012058 [Phyllostomus discolor]|uniref:Uncharacterized protein n=1 Tax=Phyllostomus discolor TaxID=89673 RepID=A0A833ZJD0_9CHIR|nr:hypothetical protein HJG60_012058 [Phyllostomus discolor]